MIIGDKLDGIQAQIFEAFPSLNRELHLIAGQHGHSTVDCQPQSHQSYAR
jgi:hypothetical protein